MNSSIKTRLERVEDAAKQRRGSGAKLYIVDSLEELATAKGIPIPGKESIVIIDDIPDDDTETPSTITDCDVL